MAVVGSLEQLQIQRKSFICFLSFILFVEAHRELVTEASPDAGAAKSGIAALGLMILLKKTP